MPENVIMKNWPSRRLLDLLQLELPIIQAPMAGSDSIALTRSVCSAGALGSLACALLSANDIREASRAISEGTPRPFNLNFFCHMMDVPNSAAKERCLLSDRRAAGSDRRTRIGARGDAREPLLAAQRLR